MEKVLDIRTRDYTFLRRAKKETPKKIATITTFRVNHIVHKTTVSLK